MDIRDRVMGDQPHSFFHKLASIVPGYQGYMDRERRRDADKILRTQLAHQYSAQVGRLNRVQQGMVRAHQFDGIAEVDRLVGVLQRFIDRLSTATYGYAGLFDPIKVEAQDLDQLYAFDMALASGVDQVSSAVDGLEAAAAPGATPGELPELPASLSRLGTLLDDLNRRLNERADLLTTGRRLEGSAYSSLLNSINQTSQGGAGTTAGGGGQTSRSSGTQGETMSTNADSANSARVQGGDESGTPTTNLNVPSNTPPAPGVSQITEGNEGFGGMQTAGDMNIGGGGPVAADGTGGSGVETASSPVQAPGAPGHDLIEGLSLENTLGGATAQGQGHVAPTDAPPTNPGNSNKDMGV